MKNDLRRARNEGESLKPTLAMAGWRTKTGYPFKIETRPDYEGVSNGWHPLPMRIAKYLKGRIMIQEYIIRKIQRVDYGMFVDL